MKGSCLCGQVRYEVQALASPIQHCACRSCRKAHAAAFNTAASVRAEDFRWLAGEDLLKSYESSPGKRRHFCAECGSHLAKTVEGWDGVMLRVATLDDDPKQVPELRIWHSHEVPWLEYHRDIVTYLEAAPKRN